MTCIKLFPLTLFSPYYSKAKQLYYSSFSREEQFPFVLLTLLSCRKTVDFWAIIDEQQFIGLVYVIHNQKTSYIFYLAIAPELQGNGYGSQTLQKIHELFPNQDFFLTIEEVATKFPNYQQRLRRKKFYEKNGYQAKDSFMVHKEHRFQVLGRQSGDFHHNKLIALFKRYTFGLINVPFTRIK